MSDGPRSPGPSESDTTPLTPPLITAVALPPDVASPEPALGSVSPSRVRDEPQEFVEAVVSGAVSEVSRVVKPAAVAVVASTFTFPLALTVMVFLFLITQAGLDHRDPKLRAAPRSNTETLVTFVDETQL